MGFFCAFIWTITADLIEENLEWKCLPQISQIYAELLFDRTPMTRMGQIFADFIEENLEWKCLPQISQMYAELLFDRTPMTRIGQIFADLIEENLEWEVSPADLRRI